LTAKQEDSHLSTKQKDKNNLCDKLGPVINLLATNLISLSREHTSGYHKHHANHHPFHCARIAEFCSRCATICKLWMYCSSTNLLIQNQTTRQAPPADPLLCATDADCVVIDKATCCGPAPTCVNAAAVFETPNCDDTMSICGFPSVSQGCHCVDSKCAAKSLVEEIVPVMPGN
jgi:hypothetical protein